MADRPLHEVVAEMEIGTLRVDRWQTTYVPCTAAEAAESHCGNTEIAHMPSAALPKLAAVLKAAASVYELLALMCVTHPLGCPCDECMVLRNAKAAAADLRRVLEGK